jgi:23S rRNA (uridine2552-2'-O)-methyltransferase
MARSRKRPRGAGRDLHTRVKTAKGRKISSTRWLQRQLNDPFVAAARREGYRSRAAFKLIDLDDRFHFLKPGASVLDLGAAPGSWAQVAVDRVHGGRPGGGRVIAVDVSEMEDLSGAEVLHLDVLDAEAPARLREAAGGAVDVVMSDMAAPATGHRQTDHLRVVALAEAALDIALQLLAPGGTFVAKVYQGGAERDLLTALKGRFVRVRHAKPEASRKESAEVYVVAQGFRGAPASASEEV